MSQDDDPRGLDLQDGENFTIDEQLKLDRIRCRYTNNRGARCEHRIFDPTSGLCLLHQRHFAQEQEERAQESTSDLLGELDIVKSRDDIRRVLSRLLRQVSAHTVERRDAAVLAYTCGLILQTLPLRKPEPKPEVEVIWDIMPTERTENAADENDQDEATEPNPQSQRYPGMPGNRGAQS